MKNFDTFLPHLLKIRDLLLINIYCFSELKRLMLKQRSGCLTESSREHLMRIL